MVFEGKFVRVYQWQQEIFDGTNTLFEQIIRVPGTMVFAATEDKIIAETEIQPGWEKELLSMPAGTFEGFDDDALERSKAELMEETGYESDDWELWKVLKTHGTITLDTYLFIARNCKKTSEPKDDGGEKISVSLLSLDDFIDHALEPTFRHQVLRSIFLELKHDEAFKQDFKKLLFWK